MKILGWNSKYSDIVREFNYDKKKDFESTVILDSILKESNVLQRIEDMIFSKTVFIVGAGPSLSSAIPVLKKTNATKIIADSALKPLIEHGIKPEIVVTDLDGDENFLKKIGKTKVIFVVHAHGDNIEKLPIVENFQNCIGTTQTKSFGKILNFGGFTDGDRAVFLANYFDAKRIVLFGMDFGTRIGKFSNTKIVDRKVKLKKLEKGKFLLEWLSMKSKSELLTTSKQIRGFKKISYKDLNMYLE